MKNIMTFMTEKKFDCLKSKLYQFQSYLATLSGHYNSHLICKIIPRPKHVAWVYEASKERGVPCPTWAQFHFIFLTRGVSRVHQAIIKMEYGERREDTGEETLDPFPSGTYGQMIASSTKFPCRGGGFEIPCKHKNQCGKRWWYESISDTCCH